jgi:hypothetical protein
MIDNSIIEEMREIEFTMFNIKKISVQDKKMQDISQIVCGRHHTVVVLNYSDIITKGKKIFAFGIEAGIGIDGVDSTHEP